MFELYKKLGKMHIPHLDFSLFYKETSSTIFFSPNEYLSFYYWENLKKVV